MTMHATSSQTTWTTRTSIRQNNARRRRSGPLERSGTRAVRHFEAKKGHVSYLDGAHLSTPPSASRRGRVLYYYCVGGTVIVERARTRISMECALSSRCHVSELVRLLPYCRWVEGMTPFRCVAGRRSCPVWEISQLPLARCYRGRAGRKSKALAADITPWAARRICGCAASLVGADLSMSCGRTNA